MKNLVLVTDLEFGNIISGKTQHLVRFFKKKLDFISRLSKGDLIYIRKRRGEVLGQFNVGKLVLVEGVEKGDYKILNEFSKEISREVFEEKTLENSIVVIIQIVKLEQFITSPIEVPGRSRKEWVVLED